MRKIFLGIIFIAITVIAAEITKEVKVKYFFPKNDTWFGVPNWFYYWRDGLGQLATRVHYVAGVNWGNTPFNDASTYVEIGNNAGFGPDPRHSKTGIDCFYAVMTHELQHLADIQYIVGRYGSLFSIPVANDNDGDMLPNEIDLFPNTQNGAGYPEYTGTIAWQGDWEYRARQVENVTANTSLDWAHPGKNWP